MTDYQALSRTTPDTHQRNSAKLARIPIKVEITQTPLRKPDWIRIKLPSGQETSRIKQILRESKLHTVCEEAACPNLAECFKHGTATFMNGIGRVLAKSYTNVSIFNSISRMKCLDGLLLLILEICLKNRLTVFSRPKLTRWGTS